MIMKVPSNDWPEQLEYVVEEDDALSDIDLDEPDFSEYLWMENEEEFDKNELQRLKEEDLMQECMEAMLADELEAELAELQKAKSEELNGALSTFSVTDCNIGHSLLNPFADEFIPQGLLINLSTS